jgi:hypothetical protein
MKWIANHRFGIWGFLVAVAFIPGIMSSAYAGRWAVLALGVPLMGRIDFKFTTAVQTALALGFGYALASLMIVHDVRGGELELGFMLITIGVMSAAAHLETLSDVMTGLCLGVGVNSVFCLFGLGGHPLVAQGSWSYAGLFYNSEVLTEFAAPLFVWALASRKWPMVALTVLPLLINGSRIAVLAAAVGLFYAYRALPWKYLLGIVVTLSAALVAVVVHRQGVVLGSVGQRIVIWLETAMAITPTGRGVGWFRSTHLAEEFAHSDVLQALSEFGIGALCFAVVPVVAFFRKRGTNAEIAAFVVICIEGIISFPLHVPSGVFLVAIVAGYLVRDGRVVRLVGYDGGILDGADDKPRFSDERGYFGGSGRLGGAIPLRHSLEGLSALGSQNGGGIPCRQ